MKVNIKGYVDLRRVYINGERLLPMKSQKILNHSPDGFAWGYGGSGPSQLALAILLHFYGEGIALKYHQPFKWAVISKLEEDRDFDIEVDLSKYVK